MPEDDDADSGSAQPIYVEVGDRVATVSAWDVDEIRDNSATKVVAAAGDLVDQGVELTRRCAEKFSAGLLSMPTVGRPSSVELSIGISLDTELGAFVAKAKAGAQLQVTLTWKLDDEHTP